MGEYMSRGDLMSLYDQDDIVVDWKLRMNFASDAANGMRYLHESDVLHLDLKSPNLLIDDRMRLKISDFGLSQALKKRGQGKQEFSAGSMLWLDPVAQEAQLVGSFSDVYSFGICMWELAAWALPYMNLLKEGVQGVGIAQRALRGERPIAIEGIPKEYEDLMIACWAQDHLTRPDFVEIADRINAMSYDRWEHLPRTLF